jgi:hypothetical protein
LDDLGWRSCNYLDGVVRRDEARKKYYLRSTGRHVDNAETITCVGGNVEDRTGSLSSVDVAAYAVNGDGVWDWLRPVRRHKDVSKSFGAGMEMVSKSDDSRLVIDVVKVLVRILRV